MARNSYSTESSTSVIFAKPGVTNVFNRNQLLAGSVRIFEQGCAMADAEGQLVSQMVFKPGGPQSFGIIIRGPCLPRERFPALQS